MRTGVACGSCGTGLRANAKFCDECGAPTAVSVDTAEYKQVTALFADVVRSMDLAAALDTERWREVMNELAEARRRGAPLRRHGEFIGDGVMAMFGAPVALEDHAFGGVWPRWPFRSRRSGSPSRCRATTAWPCGCGWA